MNFSRKKLCLILIINILSFSTINVKASIINDSTTQILQQSSTLKEKNFFKTPYVIIPAALISYGIVAQFNGPLKTLDHSTSREIEEDMNFHTTADNYLQFVPGVAVFGLKFAGVKSTHSLRDQAVVMSTSMMIMLGTTTLVKNTTKVWRPDGSSPNSFPSGHTACAFVGAQMMFREYYKTSPWLGLSGYVVATATGAIRVLNNRHWVSDVVAAAGVGILSTEVSYLLLPKINHLIFPSNKGNNSLAIAPSIGTKYIGIGGVWTF